MKFYLWGGRGIPTISEKKEAIKQIIQREGIKELLHIPFAGVGPRHRISSRCMPEEFRLFVEGLGVRYLDASYKEDIKEFDGKHIYINGGHYREFLLAMCNNSLLLEKLQQAEIIIGESSGAMILGERVLNDRKSWFEKGLWLVGNTIIIPHYNTGRRQEEELQQLHKEEQEKTGCNILWIDETSFVRYENGEYGEAFWMGGVYHL